MLAEFSCGLFPLQKIEFEKKNHIYDQNPQNWLFVILFFIQDQEMISLLKRAMWLLALALLVDCNASADQHPHLLEITSANFSSTLITISKEFDWVLMEFYAHWSVFLLSFPFFAAHFAAPSTVFSQTTNKSMSTLLFLSRLLIKQLYLTCINSGAQFVKLFSQRLLRLPPPLLPEATPLHELQ
jgi:hypothetical protein